MDTRGWLLCGWAAGDVEAEANEDWKFASDEEGDIRREDSSEG